MKKCLSVMISLMAIPFLLGMGSLQGPVPVEKIPIPVKQYSATFVDQLDVITECTQVSIEGATFLEGKRGEGIFTISFDKIQTVSLRLNAERLTGIVSLQTGEAYEMILNKNQKAYGQTKYGTFHIRLMDLKKLTIAASPQK